MALPFIPFVNSNNGDEPATTEPATTEPATPPMSAAPTPAANSYGQESYNVSPGSLVTNQVNDIISQDSPLMRKAQSEGLEWANSRGALNSDQAGAAAMGSMMNYATPLAQENARAWQIGDAANYNLYSGLQLGEQQGDIASRHINEQADANYRAQYGQNVANMIDTLLGGMMDIMGTPDQTWTDTMQGDVEGIINAFKPWASGLYGIDLA